MVHKCFLIWGDWLSAGISNHCAVISEIDEMEQGKNIVSKLNKIDYKSFHSDIHNSIMKKQRMISR